MSNLRVKCHRLRNCGLPIADCGLKNQCTLHKSAIRHPPSAIVLMWGVVSFLFLLLAYESAAQQGGDYGARRRSDTATIQLPGGARVEFKSFHSRSLGQEQVYSIFLPASYDASKSKKKYPVVYFLHGLNNDYTSWTVDRYGKLPDKVETMIKKGAIPEIIMVHPNGDNSFYTNYVDGSKKYEDYVYKDLIEHIEATYSVKPGRDYRAIGGTSMGGYGALKIAMKHTDIYAAVAGHSPIVLPEESPFSAASEQAMNSRFYGFFKSMMAHIFGDPIDQAHWADNNLLTIAKTKNGLERLKIYFDYGTSDRYNTTIHLGEGCKKLDAILTKRKIPHVFKEHPGEPHGWELVGAHIDESLPFLCQNFGK